MEEIIAFLYELQENNNREWFNQNKKQYESAKKKFESFVTDLIVEIEKIDKRIVGLSYKDCVFRIYKDVRFSKNKDPYKTHFGAYIAPGGRKSNQAGYYIHIQPGEGFAGGGIHSPQSPDLNAVRTEIYNNPQEFKKIIENKEFVKMFGEIQGDKLKTAPKGFPKDFEFIELIRYKQYIAAKNLSEKEILSPDFLNQLIEIFKVQKPFNDYINNTLE